MAVQTSGRPPVPLSFFFAGFDFAVSCLPSCRGHDQHDAAPGRESDNLLVNKRRARPWADGRLAGL